MENNQTWSYTILGNNISTETYGALHDIVIALFIPEDLKKLSKTFSNEARIKEYIEQCYETLVSYAFKTESRLGFQALGVFLMEYGGKMTDALKKLILKYSKWKEEI